MPHTPLMQRLLKLTAQAHQAEKENINVTEYVEKEFFSRRNFLSTAAKATLAATVLAGCSKTVDYNNNITDYNISNGKTSNASIAIIGAGIAGLSAAFI